MLVLDRLAESWVKSAAPALAALLLSGCAIGGGDRAWELPAQDLVGVELRLNNGSISALPGSDDTLRIEWSGGGVGNRRTFPSPVIINGVALMDARCGELCGGDLTVTLPAGLDLDATVAKGDISAQLLERADLSTCVAAGSVDLIVPGGLWDLSVDVGVGSITVDGVDHDPQAPFRIQACTGAGDVSILGL